MSRQLEAKREERQKRKDNALLLALEGGLHDAVGRAGGELVGFGVSFRTGDCLITLKAVVAGRRQISFVGGTDLGECLLKCVREANNDRLQWRADKYAESDT